MGSLIRTSSQKKLWCAQEALCLTWRESKDSLATSIGGRRLGGDLSSFVSRDGGPEMERSVEVHRRDESRTKSRWRGEVGLVKEEGQSFFFEEEDY